MRQKYRTTCFADVLVDYHGSLEDTPGWREEVVGFRLAVANDYEQVAGGNFRFPEESAGVMRIGHRGPPEKYPNVGIRLCVDWEGR